MDKMNELKEKFEQFTDGKILEDLGYVELDSLAAAQREFTSELHLGIDGIRKADEVDIDELVEAASLYNTLLTLNGELIVKLERIAQEKHSRAAYDIRMMLALRHQIKEQENTLNSLRASLERAKNIANIRITSPTPEGTEMSPLARQILENSKKDIQETEELIKAVEANLANLRQQDEQLQAEREILKNGGKLPELENENIDELDTTNEIIPENSDKEEEPEITDNDEIKLERKPKNPGEEEPTSSTTTESEVDNNNGDESDKDDEPEKGNDDNLTDIEMPELPEENTDDDDLIFDDEDVQLPPALPQEPSNGDDMPALPPFPGDKDDYLSNTDPNKNEPSNDDPNKTVPSVSSVKPAGTTQDPTKADPKAALIKADPNKTDEADQIGPEKPTKAHATDNNKLLSLLKHLIAGAVIFLTHLVARPQAEVPDVNITNEVVVDTNVNVDGQGHDTNTVVKYVEVKTPAQAIADGNGGDQIVVGPNESVYDEKTGVEITNSGDAYLHVDGTTTEQDNRDLTYDENGNGIVTEDDFQPDAAQSSQLTGEEITQEQAAQQLTAGEQENLNSAIQAVENGAEYNWADLLFSDDVSLRP